LACAVSLIIPGYADRFRKAVSDVDDVADMKQGVAPSAATRYCPARFSQLKSKFILFYLVV